MPIFDQGYQHWDGKLSSHATRWLAITRHGIAMQWKGKAVKAVFFTALIPSLILAGFLMLWSMLEQQSTLLQPFMFLFRGLPPEVLAGPKGFRTVYWTLAFHLFFNLELFFTMLLVLMVGPNLISQDLRFNAIPLYLSRPLSRRDYFIGKLGVVAFFVGLVTLVPAILAYLLGVSSSMDFDVFRDTGQILIGSIIYGFVVILSAGTLVLAFSAMSKNSRVVGAAWIGVWIISGVMGDVLTVEVKRDWCPLVSYQNNLLRIRESLIDSNSARTKLGDLMLNAAQQAARPGIFQALSKMGSRGRRQGGPPPQQGPNVTPGQGGQRPPALTGPDGRPLFVPLPGSDVYGNSTYPWTWAAGVLGTLFVLSLWTLSSRVKSLDRLK